MTYSGDIFHRNLLNDVNVILQTLSIFCLFLNLTSSMILQRTGCNGIDI